MKVGFVGWRGMVGSVLMQRMEEEGDLSKHDWTFFSTSNAGGKGPLSSVLADAGDLEALKAQEVILTCQGGEYTKETIGRLRTDGWKGHWIDAASTLRMDSEAVIVLDPINRDHINQALDKGVKTWAGGNCTVSLMLMGLGGLFEQGQVEWVTSMTYQAASGAGAANMQELVSQAGYVEANIKAGLSALELESEVSRLLRSDEFPKNSFGSPLAYSLLPFIDSEVEGGQSREEWKGMAETNKILNNGIEIPIDGICVRVGSLRCHSQAFTIKLAEDLPLDEVEDMIKGANEWVRWVPNRKETTLDELTPAAVSGTLQVPVGRVRKMNLGPKYLTAFSVGDQLLWGAAEPLRRMLDILLERE